MPTETEVASEQRSGVTMSLARGGSLSGEILRRGGGVIVLIAAIVLFIGLAPNTFPTGRTLSSLLSSEPVDICIGLAALVPLIGGEFDLSVGYILGFSDVVVCKLASSAHWPLALCVIIGLLVGVSVGAINAVLVTIVGMDAFIATLGSGFVLNGIILLLTGSNVLNLPSATLGNITYNTFADIPYSLVYVLVLAAIMFYVLDHTIFGRFLRATGANSDAARLAGLSVRRLKATSFIIGGLLAGFAGVLDLGQVGSAYPTIGPEFLLPAFAAAFLGSTMFRPGVFNVEGLLVGSLLLVVGVTGLGLVGAPTWVQPVFDGGVLIIAVGISFQSRRRALVA